MSIVQKWHFLEGSLFGRSDHVNDNTIAQQSTRQCRHWDWKEVQFFKLQWKTEAVSADCQPQNNPWLCNICSRRFCCWCWVIQGYYETAQLLGWMKVFRGIKWQKKITTLQTLKKNMPIPAWILVFPPLGIWYINSLSIIYPWITVSVKQGISPEETADFTTWKVRLFRCWRPMNWKTWLPIQTFWRLQSIATHLQENTQREHITHEIQTDQVKLTGSCFC